MSIQPNLFLHIIQNFIQNAIKFSPQNSAIIIKALFWMIILNLMLLMRELE